MAPKRKGTQQGIASSFAKAHATSQIRKSVPVEVASTSIRTIPDVYVEELIKTFGSYAGERASKERQLEQAAAYRTNAASDAAAATPADQPLAGAGLDLDELDPTAQHAAALVASRWQKKAASCISILEGWAGTDVALQCSLQEKLVAIMLHHRLHPDPVLSLGAYQLLLKNLLRHPPVKAVPLSEGAPYMLEVNEQCWHPLMRPTEEGLPIPKLVLTDAANSRQAFTAAAAFEVFQSLVTNAVLLVTIDENISSVTHREPSGAKAAQGKALLLLYLVQLLQADCNTRLAVFEQHMHSAAFGDHSLEEVDEIRRHGATALQHSLLFRLMEDDLSWRENTDDKTGRHRLVRDLVLLASTNLDSTADMLAPPTPPAAADMAACSTAVAAALQPVSAPELVSAARQLLLLMLDLYSNCEAAGVYGGGPGISKRSNDKHSDRCWLDIVMMNAIGALGAGHMLQTLWGDVAGTAALGRLLQFLPPVHRVRLIALSVAVSIHRGHDTEPQAADPLLAMFTYYEVKGKGNVESGPEFVTSSALTVARALTKCRWVVEKLLDDKEACALLLSSLVQAALTGKQLPSPADQQQFKKLMRPILQSVLASLKTGLARECSEGSGYLEVQFALGSALSLLQA